MKVQGVGNNAEYGSAGDITTITKKRYESFPRIGRVVLPERGA